MKDKLSAQVVIYIEKTAEEILKPYPRDPKYNFLGDPVGKNLYFELGLFFCYLVHIEFAKKYKEQVAAYFLPVFNQVTEYYNHKFNDSGEFEYLYKQAKDEYNYYTLGYVYRNDNEIPDRLFEEFGDRIAKYVFNKKLNSTDYESIKNTTIEQIKKYFDLLKLS